MTVEYLPSPHVTDTAELLGIERIRTRWLLEQLEAADDEIAKRETVINQLYAERG